jgi:hypothetical protein
MFFRKIALCAAFAFVACRPPWAPEPEDIATAYMGDDLTLEVANNNWSDVIIYLVHDGRRNRFTQVTAARSTSIAIPARYVSSNGSVQIVAHRIGGNDAYVSPVVSVRMGHTVALTLESSLARSTVGVW